MLKTSKEVSKLMVGELFLFGHDIGVGLNLPVKPGNGACQSNRSTVKIKHKPNGYLTIQSAGEKEEQIGITDNSLATERHPCEGRSPVLSVAGLETLHSGGCKDDGGGTPLFGGPADDSSVAAPLNGCARNPQLFSAKVLEA